MSSHGWAPWPCYRCWMGGRSGGGSGGQLEIGSLCSQNVVTSASSTGALLTCAFLRLPHVSQMPSNQGHTLMCWSVNSLGSTALWVVWMGHLNFHPGLGQDRGETGWPGTGSTLLGQAPMPTSHLFPSCLSPLPAVCPSLLASLSLPQFFSLLSSSPVVLSALLYFPYSQ